MAMVGACAFVFWPRNRLVLPLGTQEYEVISARYVQGTNVLMATDYHIKQWARRMLDKVGIQSKGWRHDIPLGSGYGGATFHAVVLLCKGPEPDEGTSFELTKYDFRLFDKKGNEVALGYQLFRWQVGPPGRTWFYSYSNDSDPFGVSSGKTSQSLGQVRVFRQSDGSEVFRLDVK